MNGNRQHNQHRGGGQGRSQAAGGRPQGGYQQPSIGPKKDDIRGFIQEDTTAKDMIKECKEFGCQLAKEKKMSTTQLRNAYGAMKKLEMLGWDASIQSKLLMIKPRLAYAAARPNAPKGMRDLSRVMADAIDAVCNEKDFQRFCNFFEATVAYFKAAEKGVMQ